MGPVSNGNADRSSVDLKFSRSVNWVAEVSRFEDNAQGRSHLDSLLGIGG